MNPECRAWLMVLILVALGLLTIFIIGHDVIGYEHCMHPPAGINATCTKPWWYL